jgi:hypothetical protein
MITTTRTYTRSFTNTPWHVDSPSIPSGLISAFMQADSAYNGKRTRTVTRPNAVTLEVSVAWNNQQDYNNYWNNSDIQSYFNAINSYYSNNNVTVSERSIQQS